MNADADWDYLPCLLRQKTPESPAAIEVKANKVEANALPAPSLPSKAISQIPDTMRLDGVLVSPAQQKIEIEILKRQLEDRDAHLKKFNEMQANVEERMDQLVRLNEELAKKKEATQRTELERQRAQFAAATQEHELAVSNLRAELTNPATNRGNQTKNGPID